MQRQGVIYLLGFSLLAGMGAYFVKETNGISPQLILFYRGLLATLFLFGFALIKGEVRDLKIRFPIATLIMAVTQGLSMYFFYLALEKTTITNAVLLAYTAPIFSALLSLLFLKENLEKKTLIGIALLFLGMIILNDVSEVKFGSDDMLGIIYGLISGFLYGAMAISSKIVVEKTKPIYAAFWQFFIIMIIFAFAIYGSGPNAFTDNIGSLVYLGWFVSGIGFLMYMKGIGLVKGQKIQVITMMEVPVASLSGVLLLGEKLSMTSIIGGLLIFIGVLVVSIRKM